jgi:cysteine sulfinate desulfinase/cysteine desulfurase-like protein
MDPSMMDPAMMDPAMMGGKQASANRQVTNDLVNLIKYAQAYRRAGKFSFTEAKTAQQRNLRNQIKLCVRDIVG